MRTLVVLCAVAAAAAQADIDVPAHLREGLAGATLRKYFQESGGWFTGTVEGVEDDGRVRVHWHEDGTRTHLGLEEAHRHRVDDDDSLAYTDDEYAQEAEEIDDPYDDDDDALDAEERRELSRKRRLHLQRRAEAAKKRAQHLRDAAAARAVDERREKEEREATDAIFEKPPPVPPVPPGGNIFRLQVRGPFKAHGGAKKGQIYSETRDEGAGWRVGWLNHGGSMKKFFVRLAGPLVDEASGLLCTQRGDVRALSMHVAFRMNGDVDDGSLRDKTNEGFALWLTDKISPWTGPVQSMDLRQRGDNPNTLGVWARASGEVAVRVEITARWRGGSRMSPAQVVVEANGQVIERCSAATRFRTGSGYHPALNVTRLRVDVEPQMKHASELVVSVEIDEGRGAGFKPCGRVDLPSPLDAAWLHGAYPAITGASSTDAVDLVRFAAAGSVDENDGEDTVEEALRRLNVATSGSLRYAVPLRDDRHEMSFGERMNALEVALSTLDANFAHLMWVIEHAMLQRRDHVNELLQNQARQQAKDVRKLKALEEEYNRDVEDHLESKIEELEERLAGHAHREGAHAESRSFEETHERFEEVREMKPSGGYLSGLLWVVVLMHVAGGVAYYRAYAHLKKQTKVV